MCWESVNRSRGGSCLKGGKRLPSTKLPWGFVLTEFRVPCRPPGMAKIGFLRLRRLRHSHLLFLTGDGPVLVANPKRG